MNLTETADTAGLIIRSLTAGTFSVRFPDRHGVVRPVGEFEKADLDHYQHALERQVEREEAGLRFLAAIVAAAERTGVQDGRPIGEWLPADEIRRLRALEIEIIADITLNGPLPGLSVTPDGHLLMEVASVPGIQEHTPRKES